MRKFEEVDAHVEAIGKWAAENPKRVAFVVCGEMTGGGVTTVNSLVGRSDRIGRAIYGNAMEDESFKSPTMLAAKMIENPLFATIFCMKASEDEPSENKSGFSEVLKDLLGAIAEKLRKDD